MNAKTLLLISVLSVLALGLGYLSFNKDIFIDPMTAEVVASPSPSVVVFDTDAERRWRQLSDEQKITQLLAVGLKVTPQLIKSPETASSAGQLAWIAKRQPGTVVVFGSQLASEDVASFTKALTTDVDLPPVIAVDHEGGTVQRLNGRGFTSLPSWREQCLLPEESYLEQISQSAQQLKSVGINMVFAPVVDLASSSTTLKSRVCGNDPQLVSQRTNKWLVTFWEQNIISVIKHFPGIGQTNKDLHTSFQAVSLQQVEATVFRSLLEEWPQAAVMTSHVGLINQNADVPCSLSRDCVGELVINFPAALVVTDALEMAAAGYLPTSKNPVASGSSQLKTRSLPDRAVAAVEAGNTILLFGDGVDSVELDQVMDALLLKYRSDPTFKKTVDANGVKFLGYKRKLGVSW